MIEIQIYFTWISKRTQTKQTKHDNVNLQRASWDLYHI